MTSLTQNGRHSDLLAVRWVRLGKRLSASGFANSGTETKQSYLLELHSSAMLRSRDRQFHTDVTGQPIGPIFKGLWTN